ncbi:mitochondrial amidoxime reducing component 2-like [Tubulanus polymorphus]|uniref:mitochondrial amidoxime reducing component 2-like n=1 Tax=Tubulanus polymorphus TaxID=672921 RepID=UPI003DA5699E
MMENIGDAGLVFFSLLAGSAAKIGMAYWTQKHARKNMEKVGEISAMYIHPVKSCRGWSISEATATKLGLECSNVYDRLFMLADEKNKYRHVNLRIEPLMALIVPSLHVPNMHLDAPNMETLVLPLEFKATPGSLIDCKVYDEHFKGVDCGDKASAWFCKYLKREGLRLLYRANVSECLHQRSFSDEAPHMFLSTASLADLNERLAEPVPMRRFRPNFVISGCSAYDEDNWEEVIIGTAHFKRLDTCRRCTLIMVDPETGQKDPNSEPLQTLKSYRMEPGSSSPGFGNHFGLISSPGKICIGDGVYVMRKP